MDDSRAAIAEVRSSILDVVVLEDLWGVDDPECAGRLDCFVLTLGMSGVKKPDAAGDNFCRGRDPGRDDIGDGSTKLCTTVCALRATGSCDRARAFDKDVVVDIRSP